MTLPPSDKFEKWLDIVENAEPITSARLVALMAAAILGALDAHLNVSQNPLLASALAYLVVTLVTWAWERGQVWSQRSHVREVERARTQQD